MALDGATSFGVATAVPAPGTGTRRRGGAPLGPLVPHGCRNPAEEEEGSLGLGCRKELALSAGLAAADADEAWEDPEGAWGARVEAEVAEGRALGSTGVPFFVVDRHYGLTGAQGAEAFLELLEKASGRGEGD